MSCSHCKTPQVLDASWTSVVNHIPLQEVLACSNCLMGCSSALKFAKVH